MARRKDLAIFQNLEVGCLYDGLSDVVLGSVAELSTILVITFAGFVSY